jgi:hypothetical protein
MLATPALIIGLEWAEKKVELFQDGGQIKREKDKYHHGHQDQYLSFFICHLRDPPLVLIGHYLQNNIIKSWKFMSPLLLPKTSSVSLIGDFFIIICNPIILKKEIKDV